MKQLVFGRSFHHIQKTIGRVFVRVFFLELEISILSAFVITVALRSAAVDQPGERASVEPSGWVSSLLMRVSVHDQLSAGEVHVVHIGGRGSEQSAVDVDVDGF